MNTLNEKSKSRRNYWLLIEKIAGCVLLLWSMFVLYSMSSVVADMFRTGYIASGNASFNSILIKNHLIIIISILCLFGSWMLLFKDKTGWILCVISALIYSINLFMSSRSKAIDNKLAFAEHYKSYGIASLLFFVIFLLLLLKPIRTKYHPTIKTWILTGGIIAVCILDKIIFK